MSIDACVDDVSLPLVRAFAGFERSELLGDVLSGGVRTLVAPVDRAFAVLPWTFDDLLSVGRVEERCELFEYYAIPLRCEARGPMRTMPTLQRELITIGCGYVVGPDRAARILASLRWGDVIVHAVDACVLPSTLIEQVGAARWPSWGREQGRWVSRVGG